MQRARFSGRQKFILGLVVLVTGTGLALAGWLYLVFLAPNIQLHSEEDLLFIPTGATYPQVSDSLAIHGFLKDKQRFERVASLLDYPRLVKPGKYRIRAGMSNLQLVRLLRSGQQEPVRLTLHQARTVEELAGKMAARLEPDSAEILQAFVRLRDFAPDIPLGEDSALCLVIPNTYEVWWNISPSGILDRLWKENQRFWHPERLEKAKRLGLTPVQVYILASIVEKETRVVAEKSTLAGVYLNRLRIGMPLQADPTVVFALGDFSRERVLHSDLSFDSPYNTYLYNGLPPGPICMPEINSIQAVLEAEQHEYLYFCARADNSGAHVFARTLEAHAANARRFRKWLDEKGILR